MLGFDPSVSVAPAGQPRADASRAPVSTAADFQTFLRMLTVQMQNQDPLNPMESQDFAVQLATFSGVEQQVRSNQLLESLSARLGMSELAGWVGMEALTNGPAHFDGRAIELVPQQVHGADRARLVVLNSFGTEVASRALDPSAGRVMFDGIGADGFTLPSGSYSFHVESSFRGEVIAATPAASFSRVQEARFEGGSVRLMMEGGAMIDTAAVRGLRAPQPA